VSTAQQMATLRRQWDDVPGRAELSQYRNRLTELSDQGNISFINPAYIIR